MRKMGLSLHYLGTLIARAKASLLNAKEILQALYSDQELDEPLHADQRGQPVCLIDEPCLPW